MSKIALELLNKSVAQMDKHITICVISQLMLALKDKKFQKFQMDLAIFKKQPLILHQVEWQKKNANLTYIFLIIFDKINEVISYWLGLDNSLPYFKFLDMNMLH